MENGYLIRDLTNGKYLCSPMLKEGIYKEEQWTDSVFNAMYFRFNPFTSLAINGLTLNPCEVITVVNFRK